MNNWSAPKVESVSWVSLHQHLVGGGCAPFFVCDSMSPSHNSKIAYVKYEPFGTIGFLDVFGSKNPIFSNRSLLFFRIWHLSAPQFLAWPCMRVMTGTRNCRSVKEKKAWKNVRLPGHPKNRCWVFGNPPEQPQETTRKCTFWKCYMAIEETRWEERWKLDRSPSKKIPVATNFFEIVCGAK